jgi:hypothetical protein
MFFGKKLKELRLKYASMGLHNFANKINMSVLLYNEIERGLVPPPPCRKWIGEVMVSLNMEFGCSDAVELYDLWGKPFVMQKMNDSVVCSPLTHKSDGTPLTTEEYLKLNEHINSHARKHNKIADEYNELHG